MTIALKRRIGMNPKNDLQIALMNWGPTKAPIDKKSIELWGRINPEIIIEMRKVLGQSPIITELPIPKPGNKEQRR